MAADFHGHAFLHSESAKVANPAPSQIVEQQIRNTGASAYRFPDLSETSHCFTAVPREHAVIRLLSDAASRQQRSDFLRQFDDTRRAVLRFASFQANRAIAQVHLLDFQPEQLALAEPSQTRSAGKRGHENQRPQDALSFRALQHR